MTSIQGFGEIKKNHLKNGTVVQVLKPIIKGHLEMAATCCSCAKTSSDDMGMFLGYLSNYPWFYFYFW